MKLQSKLFALIISIAGFILVLILGISFVATRRTVERIRNLGREQSSVVLSARAGDTAELIYSMAESDFLRVANVYLPDYRQTSAMSENDLRKWNFPDWIDRIAIAPYKATAQQKELSLPILGVKRAVGDGESELFSKEELAALGTAMQECFPGFGNEEEKAKLSGFHTNPTCFLVVGGEIWAATVRFDADGKDACCFFLRLTKHKLAGRFLQNTATHFVLLDSQGHELLNTSDFLSEFVRLPSVSSPEVSALLGRVKDANRAYAHDIGGRWFCVAMKIHFPEYGMTGMQLVRYFDIPTMSPVVAKRVNSSIAKLQFLLFCLLVSAVTAVLIATVLFAKRIASPIVAAADFADILSTGEFPEQLPPDRSGITEAERLNVSLNRMRDRLNSMITKLNRSRQRELNARCAAEDENRMRSDFSIVIARNISKLTDVCMGLLSFVEKAQSEGKDVRPEIPAELRSRLVSLHVYDSLLTELIVQEPEMEQSQVKVNVINSMNRMIREAGPWRQKRNLSFRTLFASDVPAAIYVNGPLFFKTLRQMVHAVLDVVLPGTAVSFAVEVKENRLFFRIRGQLTDSFTRLLPFFENDSRKMLPENISSEIIRFVIAQKAAANCGAELQLAAQADGSYIASLFFDRDDVEADAESGESFYEESGLEQPKRVFMSSRSRKVETGKVPKVVLSLLTDEITKMYHSCLLEEIPGTEKHFAASAEQLADMVRNGIKPDIVIYEPSVTETLNDKIACLDCLNALFRSCGLDPLIVFIGHDDILAESGELFRHSVDIGLVEPVEYSDLAGIILNDPSVIGVRHNNREKNNQA